MATSVTVGGIEAGWDPVRLRCDGRLSSHEAAGFPPGPVPLVARAAHVDRPVRPSLRAHHARDRLHARADRGGARAAEPGRGASRRAVRAVAGRHRDRRERLARRRHRQPGSLLGTPRLGRRGVVAAVHGPLRRRPRRARPGGQRRRPRGRGRVRVARRPGGAGAPRGLDGAPKRGGAAERSSWSWARRAASCGSPGRSNARSPCPCSSRAAWARHLARASLAAAPARELHALHLRGPDRPRHGRVHRAAVTGPSARRDRAGRARRRARVPGRAGRDRPRVPARARRAGRAPGGGRAARPGRLRLRPGADLDDRVRLAPLRDGVGPRARGGAASRSRSSGPP